MTKETQIKTARSKLIKALLSERAARRKSPIAKRMRDFERIVDSRDYARNALPRYNRRGLSTRQRRVLEQLEEAAEDMLEAPWLFEQDPDMASKAYLDEASALGHAIRKAINAGLTDHPIVRNWISNQRTFGERKTLRSFKRIRLERGVKKPLTIIDFWVKFEAQALSEEGYGWQDIRLILCKRLRDGNLPDFVELTKPERYQLRRKLKNMSRQGFLQKLISLGLCSKQ